MRFDWLISFAFGFVVAAVLLGAWHKRLNRLRWITLRTAVAAGISIEQYAKDLETAERGEWK